MVTGSFDVDARLLVAQSFVVHTPPNHTLVWSWWRHGGRTDLDNLLPICTTHHSNIHHDNWTIELGPNRQLTLTLPDGTTRTTGPPTIRAA